MSPADVISGLGAIVGPRYVTGPGADMEPFVVDWRGRYRGEALAVVKPGSTAEVSELVRWCMGNDIAIVPQGGNTGMCAGSIPLAQRPSVIVRLDRMNTVRWVSRLGDAIAVDAGCILADVQAAAEERNRLFPLSLGAEGSCQIGGNLSTNAGGTAVLRYGTMRELTLGLEVVLPSGEVMDMMTSLRKDSTGYDLKQLFIGAEGTLGIITGAVLKLFPQPRRRAVALAKLERIEAALDLLALARTRLGERIGSFEIMSRGQIEVIAENLPDVQIPFALDTPWYLLIELVDTLEEMDLDGAMEGLLGAAFEADLVSDAIVAASEAQADALWKIRHSVSEGSKKAGYVVSHDSSVPLEAQAEFVNRISARIAEVRPDARLAIHGHVGDGNLHVLAIIPGIAQDRMAEMKDAAEAINRAVDDVTAELKGSISAEHGIGATNRARLARVADPVELAWMARVKTLFDPAGLMNPGKVLPDASARAEEAPLRSTA
ncbi:FAD-binding oxidoreductase [Aquabacter sp. CN5-332]|uniref:FAD-binding oxidoreductase n=1 Tax=Aquabacter sp. CN5-332 TaxID=3156608 RepID=UPI0032B48B7D